MTDFKSFLGTVRIEFSDAAGMTMIAGDNRVEPRLGANGAGKSSIWDGVCFCNYGTSVNGTRINDLVARGAKSTSVTCGYDIDGNERTVSRAGPPARLRIDKNLVEQADVERLLGRTRKQWLHSVLYGQGMPLFIDLPIPERGELLDEVLDLEIWMKAAKKAGDRHAAITADLNRLRIEVGRTEGALSSLEDVVALEGLSKEWRRTHRAKLQEVKRQLAESTQAEKALREKLSAPDSAPDPDAVYRRIEKQQGIESDLKSRLAVCGSELARIGEDLEFFRDNAQCPSCGQEIDQDLAQEHIAKHKEECERIGAEQVRLGEEWIVVTERIAKLRHQWTATREKSRARDADLARLKSEVHAKMREAQSHLQQVAILENEKDPHRARIDAVRQQRQDLQVKLERQKSREAQFNSKLLALDFWKQGFRRARLFCINRVLRQLDIEAANSAQSLGLVGWKIAHTTETETKAGTQKLGVQIQVQAPHMSGPFSAWSGGEGQRVRLATALGFGSLIQRWMGVRWQQEVFDEPTNWLSDAGIEDLLECLRIRADVMGKRIFLCDHRGLQNSGFSQVLTVIKDQEGSRIQ